MGVFVQESLKVNMAKIEPRVSTPGVEVKAEGEKGRGETGVDGIGREASHFCTV
jgi:hypothetical protein